VEEVVSKYSQDTHHASLEYPRKETVYQEGDAMSSGEWQKKQKISGTCRRRNRENALDSSLK
jgi:hypothetical protein